MMLLGKRRAAAARSKDLPKLKAAPRREQSLTESVSADVTNVVRSMLVPGLTVLHVLMISSIYLSNMIVRLIMGLHKMFWKRATMCLMLKLLVGSVLHHVEKRDSMNLLV